MEGSSGAPKSILSLFVTSFLIFTWAHSCLEQELDFLFQDSLKSNVAILSQAADSDPYGYISSEKFSSFIFLVILFVLFSSLPLHLPSTPHGTSLIYSLNHLFFKSNNFSLIIFNHLVFFHLIFGSFSSFLSVPLILTFWYYLFFSLLLLIKFLNSYGFLSFLTLSEIFVIPEPTPFSLLPLTLKTA